MASERAMYGCRLWGILLMVVCVGCSNFNYVTTDPNLTEILGRVGALEDVVIKQQRLITDLQNDRDLQKEANTKLRNDLEKQKSLVINLQHGIDRGQDENMKLRGDLAVQEVLITDLQSDLGQLNANIQQKMDEHQIFNNEIQKDVDKLKQLIGVLENNIENKDNFVAELQNEVSVMKKEKSNVLPITPVFKGQSSKVLDGQTTENDVQHNYKYSSNGSADRQNKQHTKRSPPQTRQIDSEATVAFSTGLTKHLTNIGVNQNIVFDKVEINEGNGYNPHHGIFVAPVPGIYVFFSTLYASHGYAHTVIFCHFTVNGILKNSIYAESASDASDTGSQMLIAYLHQGDDVAMQTRTALGNLYAYPPEVFSTFSGFLLRQGDFGGNVVVG